MFQFAFTSTFNMFTNRFKQNSEQESKFVQDRIQLAERNIAELCIAFGAYSRKAARMRDAGDELTIALQNYANNETVNESLGQGLTNLATSFNRINNYGDKRVTFIEKKVTLQLAPYEEICKVIREQLKTLNASKDKEGLRQRQLERIKERNPRHRRQIVEAETELVQAKAEVSRSIHNLGDKLLSFERQKLQDLKDIFFDFVATEIGYHSKAISLLTEAYANVNLINIESDLQDTQRMFDELDPKFKTKLQAAPSTAKPGNLAGNSNSMNALNTGDKQGIPNDNKSLSMQKAQSAEIITQPDESPSQVSESDYTDSDTDEPSADQENAASKQYTT